VIRPVGDHEALAAAPFHDSLLFALLLAGAVIAYCLEMSRQLISSITFMGSPLSIGEFVFYLLRTPSTYIMLGVCVLSLQLGWTRWRRRHETAVWEIACVAWRPFAWNWLALALLFVVGLSVVSIYCFAFWLGPWYLYGP
jgi:hypothetical protein